MSEAERLRTKQAMENAASSARAQKSGSAIGSSKTLIIERAPLSESEVKESTFYRDLELTADALRNKVSAVLFADLRTYFPALSQSLIECLN